MRVNRWTLVLGAVGVLYVGTLVAMFVVAHGGGPFEQVGGGPMMLLAVVAGVAALRAAGRADLDPGSRRAWRLVALSMVAMLATSVLFAVPGVPTAFPAPADAVRFVGVVLLFFATRSFPVASAGRLEQRKSALDAVVVVLGASMLMWFAVVGPYVAKPGQSAWIAVAASVYAIADLVLLFGCARILLRGSDRATRRPVGLLGGGVLFLIISDAWLGFVKSHATGTDFRNVWQFSSLVTMHVLFAAGAVDQCRRLRPPSPGPDMRVSVAGRLPYVAVAAGYGLMVVAAVQDRVVYPWAGLVAGSLGMTGAVMLRQLTVQRESDEAAATDGLTGLANRVRFHHTLARALERDGRNRHGTAVLLIDLNGFKQVNDTLGHKAGDQLLVAFAEMLRSSILGADVAARIGGDEFAVVVHDAGTPAAGEAVARRIAAATEVPVLISDTLVSVSASIGIACSGPGELRPDELVHRADLAMYHAKHRDGESRWDVWAETMGDRDADQPSGRVAATVTGHEDFRG